MKISVIGLGYVGLPLALELSKKYEVIGYDINQNRIAQLKLGIDNTQEVKEFKNYPNIQFSADKVEIEDCNIYIVTVPTPISEDKIPDLNPLISASQLIGSILKKEDIVIYESTVYPGVTEEVCGKVLEETSGLISGEDFFLGYSPERINPGDKKNNVTNVIKVVSAQNPVILKKISAIYNSIVKVGIHEAPTIKVAEAAKVIENTQRDLNISLMNELSVIFERLEIDTQDVLDAAGTKWNFLKFKPGLVGGHCIAVDPYYLTYKAEKVGYIPEVILAGRRVNDNMGQFIASTIVKKMIKQGMSINGSVVSILGITFKENVTDIRNSKVIDLVREINEYGMEVQVIDSLANKDEVKEEYDINLIDKNEAKKADVVILAVPHEEYISDNWNTIKKFTKDTESIVIDIKSVLNRMSIPENITLWRL